MFLPNLKMLAISNDQRCDATIQSTRVQAPRKTTNVPLALPRPSKVWGGLKSIGATFDQFRNVDIPEVFLNCILKLTMGEAVTKQRFIARKFLTHVPELKCKVGPYKNDEPISLEQLDGDYLRLVVPLVMQYLERSVMLGVKNKVCFCHGGISHLDNEDSIGVQLQKKFFPMMTLNETTRLCDMSYSDSSIGTRNDIHKLCMNTGKSYITGRMYVWEACLKETEAVKQHLHPKLPLMVNGHTPQWSGIPMIVKEDGRYAIILDTQFTNRQTNTHALITSSDGRFMLQGSWEGQLDYIADSSDPLIGTMCDFTTPVYSDTPEYTYSACKYRVICRKKDDPNVYIAVRYITRNGAPFEAPGKTQMITFQANAGESEARVLEFKRTPPDVISSDGYMVKLEVPPSGEPAYPLSAELQTYIEPTAWCGDIEASVDFLVGFLEHATNLAGVARTEMGDFGPRFVAALTAIGFQEDFAGIWGGDREERVFHLSYDLEKSGVKLGCIGDVVGDPTGTGNHHRTGNTTHLLDELVCILWAVTQTDEGLCAAGNRDMNKLRFLDELKYFITMKNNSPEWVKDKMGPLNEFARLGYDAVGPSEEPSADAKKRREAVAAAKTALLDFVLPIDNHGNVMHFKQPQSTDENRIMKIGHGKGSHKRSVSN